MSSPHFCLSGRSRRDQYIPRAGEKREGFAVQQDTICDLYQHRE